MNTVHVNDVKYDITPIHLKEGSIFGALSESSVSFLLKKGVLHHLEKGEDLFSSGSSGSSFHVVLHGKLDFYKKYDDNEVFTRSIAFGEAIGFVSMIALHERDGSAIAAEESIVLEISSGLFCDFHDQYPFDFGILLMNLSRDMARTIRKLSDLLVKNIETESRNDTGQRQK